MLVIPQIVMQLASRPVHIPSGGFFPLASFPVLRSHLAWPCNNEHVAALGPGVHIRIRPVPQGIQSLTCRQRLRLRPLKTMTSISIALNSLIASRRSASRALCVFALCLLSLPLYAQQEGEGPLVNTPPKGITADDLIKRFATKEKEFKLAREQYTWTQSVKVQTLEGNAVDGEYQQVSDVVFDDRGRRITQVKFAPQNTLSRLTMTQEDFDDIEKRMPFTMTIDDLPYYNVHYLGQQQEDELNCYVFDLSPKKIDKGQRYFEGRIWVDDHDFQIVKTYGKNVPDLGKAKKGDENLFPRFTTWREQIDGQYWFPTYTKVDDNLHFTMGDIHIRQVVKYENYRRFGSNTRVIFEGQEIKNDNPKNDKK